jgi:hypothetical protein
VVYFLRAVERADGWWACKRGRAEVGAFPTLDEALAHLDALGAGLDGEVEVRVHSGPSLDRQTSDADR